MTPRRRQALVAAALFGGLLLVPGALAGPRPDLRISALQATPVAITGERIVVSAKVVNSGRTRAPASTLRFSRVGGPRLASFRIPSLRSGQSFLLRSKVRAPTGRYTVVACADAVRRVVESWERNNCARTRNVSVAPLPPQPRFLSRPPAVTNATAFRIDFAGTGLFECRLDRGRFAPCTSPVQLDVGEGLHEFAVRARDVDGRRGVAAVSAWRVDLTPPSAPLITSHPPSLTNSSVASFTIDAEPGARLACRLSESAFFGCNRTETWHLPEGSYELGARATDAAGNEGATTQFRWLIDLTPPPAPVVSERPPAETYVRSARITFSFPAATEPTTRSCRYDATPVPCTSPLILAGPLRPGAHSLSLVASDEAGNEGSAAVNWTVLPRADGVYAGPGGPSSVVSFESWRGTPTGRVLEYLRRGTWPDIEGASTPDVIARWRGSPFRLVLSTPMLPTSGATLAQGATGAHNSHFRALAEKLVAEGHADAVIRLGWEFNGDWFPWSAGSDPESFKAYWRQIVATMRGVVGARFSFDWCPNIGPSRMKAELAYPGNDVVDYIGLSAFDAAWGAPNAPTPEWRWGVMRNQPFGLAWQRDFAAARNKPMTYPEWGLWEFTDPSYYTDGGSDGRDDPYYIEHMFEWVNANEVAYALYFEYDSPVGLHRMTTGRFPNAAARYRALFGSL